MALEEKYTIEVHAKIQLEVRADTLRGAIDEVQDYLGDLEFSGADGARIDAVSVKPERFESAVRFDSC